MIDWTAIQGAASVLALIVNAIVALSLFVSIRALRQAEATKESAIFIWALDRIREVRPTMNAIRDCAGDPRWLGENRDQVMKVLDVIQMITFMAEEGVIDRQKIINMWGKSIVEQWVFLNGFVREFREKIGEPATAADGAFFARSFEKFADAARSDLDRRFNIAWPKLLVSKS